MDSLIFYFDRNVGRRLPEALELLRPVGVKKVIHHHTERRMLEMRHSSRRQPLFKPEEKDDVWLEFVGQKRWIVFTQDRKFHKAGFESELSAIKQFGIGCFYLWGASAPTCDKASSFLQALPHILRAAIETKKPYIFEISKSGRLTSVQID